MSEPSSPSLLHLTDGIVDASVFSDLNVLRHHPSNPLSPLSIFLLILHVSEAYSNTEPTLDL